MSDKTSDSITMTDCTFTSTALADVRNAALEEAAAEMEHREQVATTARDSYLKISSPSDAARHEHYRVAYCSTAAAIRGLKEGKAE